MSLGLNLHLPFLRFLLVALAKLLHSLLLVLNRLCGGCLSRSEIKVFVSPNPSGKVHVLLHDGLSVCMDSTNTSVLKYAY